MEGYKLLGPHGGRQLYLYRCRGLSNVRPPGTQFVVVPVVSKSFEALSLLRVCSAGRWGYLRLHSDAQVSASVLSILLGYEKRTFPPFRSLTYRLTWVSTCVG